MDNIREKDLKIINRNGEDWVVALSGGVSCFDDPALLPAGQVWRLPWGTIYPDELYLRGPAGQGHWTWEPAIDMPLADFRALLASVGRNFK